MRGNIRTHTAGARLRGELLMHASYPMEEVNDGPGSAKEEEEVPVWQAHLRHIYISSGHDYWGRQGEGRLQSGINEVTEIDCVAGKGLRGDRYFAYKPDFKGQVTFFDAAVVEQVRQTFKLPKLPASVFRRNLIVEGVDLREWMGKRFSFQGVEFEGSQECTPCHWMDRAIADGAEEFLKGRFRGGLRAKVRTSGMLRVGEWGTFPPKVFGRF